MKGLGRDWEGTGKEGFNSIRDPMGAKLEATLVDQNVDQLLIITLKILIWSYLIEEMIFLDCVKVTIFWRVAKNDNHSVSYHMCRVAHTEKELKFWYFVVTYREII